MGALSYDDFIAAKAAIAPRFGGMRVDEAALNPLLKPHTRRMVAWALHGGRRAWFANFGLHKTATQLETMRVLTETTGRPTLITAPLGVRREFMREAQERFRGSWAVDLKFIRSSDQVDGPGIYLTNYESVRDGKVSPDPFVGVSLDEAAVLRGFGGTKTFREFMALDRAIAQFTEPGAWVFDPFGGLMAVPFRAIKLGRKGIGVELNKGYWLDGAKYCAAAQREVATPGLFDFLDAEQPENQKLRRTA